MILVSCEETEPGFGKITLKFNHTIDSKPIIFNELVYTNAANNLYEVTEIQWFISDVIVIDSMGHAIALTEEIEHYVDTNLPQTFIWRRSDKITPGNYQAVRFTFGLKGAHNKPGTFLNPPESNMLWPFNLGGGQGGYHYMKLNGFWMNDSDQRTPFNFHLGVGQLYGTNGAVMEYVQNWFEVEIPVKYSIRESYATELDINMHVDSWFETPYVYDHNIFGSMIMKNQEAQEKIKANGYDVFTIGNK